MNDRTRNVEGHEMGQLENVLESTLENIAMEYYLLLESAANDGSIE